MKKLLVLLTGILLFSCSKKQEIFSSITLSNPSSFERITEPIIINQDKINTVLGINNTLSIYFEDENGVQLPFQKDEFHDKVEFSLSVDFKANESKKIMIKIADSTTKIDFIKYTNIRLGKDEDADGIFNNVDNDNRNMDHLPGSIPVLYQSEGISWENDKVGFRSYWDKRNGKDIWGKTTDKMVLDSIGLPNTPSYHGIQPWGSDILKVGNSLGAGALAMKKGNKLFRLGTTDSAAFKVLTEGSIRSIFQLDYKGWNVEGESFDLTEIITIWKGKYGYKSDLILKGSNQRLVTGIVNINLQKDSLYIITPNLSKTILYTFDQQSEFKGQLGLGLILNSNELVAINKAPNKGTGKSIDGGSPISHTYYAELQSKDNQVSFYFFAGWEQSNSQFKTRDDFKLMLINEAEKMNMPIILE